jgi:hypothetical protein
MKLIVIGLVALLLTSLTGCTLFPQKQAVTPPPAPAPPKPVAPEPPLSIPQTTAQLPTPQPVNPDAIPPAPAPQPTAEKTEAAPARPAKRPSPKPETTQEAEQPAPQPAPADTAEAAPFQPILSPQEQARLKNSIEVRRREINDRLLKNSKNPSPHDKGLIDRINSFVDLSSKAEQRGDFTQADALLERASILARELPIE